MWRRRNVARARKSGYAVVARRDESRRQIAEIDATLKNLQSGLVPAQRMNALLQDVLKRNPRLQLIALSTLPATPLVDKRAPAEKTGSASSGSLSTRRTRKGNSACAMVGGSKPSG